MVSEATPTQVSAPVVVPAPAATPDNPSPALAGAEQGSTAAAPAAPTATEHRAETAQQQQQQQQQEDFNQRYQSDRVFRSYVDDITSRRAKSMTDKGLVALRKQWEQQQAQREAEWQTRQREEQELTEDEYELGKRRKEELQRKRLVEPYMEQARQEGLLHGTSRGYQRAYEELAQALEESDSWKALSPPQRRDLINSSASVSALVGTIAKRDARLLAQRELEAERAKLREGRQREERAAERSTSPTPDTGEGSPGQSDRDFLQDFASGKATDFKRARKLLGM